MHIAVKAIQISYADTDMMGVTMSTVTLLSSPTGQVYSRVGLNFPP